MSSKFASTKGLITSGKSLAASVKSYEQKVHRVLSQDNIKMLLRVLIVVHILITKYLPSGYLSLINSMTARVFMALFVVYLAFIDLISATLFALLFVLAVQEVQVRNIAKQPAVTLPVVNAPILQSTLNNLVSKPEVYGDAGLVQSLKRGSEFGITNYHGQVGELEITREMEAAPATGVQVVDGVASVKVNMGQTGTGGLDVGNTSFGLIKEAFTTQSTEEPPMGSEYDHPASKTITENIRISNTGYVTPKNLVDIQINSAQGSEVQDEVRPCAVGSFKTMWNAQGLGGMNATSAYDPTACPCSRVA